MNKYAISILLVLFFLSVPVSGYCTRCAASNITATIDVNYTFTGAPGTDALVTNIGSNVDALLDFTVPAGADGVMEGDVSHNLLLNLTTSDDHSQYPNVSGRAGGQTLTGGTTAGNLVLNGSANNGGYVVIQPNGGNVTIGTGPNTNRLSVFGGEYGGGLFSHGIMISDVVTNLTSHFSYIKTLPYDISQKPFVLFYSQTTATSNLAYFGGGTSYGQAATGIRYFTGLVNTATGTERMRIDSLGNVGIGVTPTSQFDVAGSTRFRNCSGTPTMDAGGNMTCVSDEKYKTAITPYISAPSKLVSVVPKSYKWSVASGFDTTHVNTGFSAQEMQAVYPECVIARDDMRYEQRCTGKGEEETCETQEIKTGTQTLALDDKCLIAVLWNAAKDQQLKINDLETRLKKLEGTSP